MLKIAKALAKHPGDSIMTLRLRRGNELGSIRVQDYGEATMSHRYKVGAFLPGKFQDLPGDTPKVWPEVDQWTSDIRLARCFFYLLASRALVDGWDLLP